MQPKKEDPNRVQLTVGGNRIEYPGKLTTKMAYLTTFKIHINSVISTQGARYACWDIGNYHLETLMGRSECMIIHIRFIPSDIITHDNLIDLVDKY